MKRLKFGCKFPSKWLSFQSQSTAFISWQTEVINQRRERVALLRTTFFRYNVLRAEPVTRGSTRGRGPASAHDAGSSPA